MDKLQTKKKKFSILYKAVAWGGGGEKIKGFRWFHSVEPVTLLVFGLTRPIYDGEQPKH